MMPYTYYFLSKIEYPIPPSYPYWQANWHSGGKLNRKTGCALIIEAYRLISIIKSSAASQETVEDSSLCAHSTKCLSFVWTFSSCARRRKSMNNVTAQLVPVHNHFTCAV